MTNEAQGLPMEPFMLPVKRWNRPSVKGPILAEYDPKLGAN